MYKVAVIGECMIELYEQEPTVYKQTFGGDTFNCAVYLKRSFKNLQVEYITLIGDDKLSFDMLEFFKSEDIGTKFVKILKNKFSGLYMIHTVNGERNFSYWRDTSAAKELFCNFNYEELENFDLIYFSAITLAIMSDSGRKKMFDMIKRARNKGVKVAFDSNYRPRLYSSIEEAKENYDLALSSCDIFLPSIEDEQYLWNVNCEDEIIEKANNLGCKEIVIKRGKKDIIYSINGKKDNVKIKKVENIVDSTSAGDSFNGAYLASRLEGKSVEDSIEVASHLSSKVIQYQGAIIPKEKNNERTIQKITSNTSFII